VNALTHGVLDGPVHVAARRDGEEVEISVRNVGPPIPAAVLPALFEPSSPAQGAQDRRGGLGLGLYIVRQIASAHGGAVTVRSSDAETVFTLRLPRAGPRRP